MPERRILTAIHARMARELALAAVRYVPIRVDRRTFGWVDPTRGERLLEFAAVFERDRDGIRLRPSLATCAARTDALDAVARTLAAEGALSPWRDERFAVTERLGAAPDLLLERAAARYFGIRTHATHANGIAPGEHGPAMWIARRSPTKAIDPGQLDNLVGGGIAAGSDPDATLVREAREEAGIPAALAATAQAAGTVRLCRSQPDGLQRETIYVYDLALPEGFVPRNEDGEVVEHRLVPVAALAGLLAHDAGAQRVTTDASLVIVDWLLRSRRIDEASPEGAALAALRYPPDVGEAIG